MLKSSNIPVSSVAPRLCESIADPCSLELAASLSPSSSGLHESLRPTTSELLDVTSFCVSSETKHAKTLSSPGVESNDESPADGEPQSLSCFNNLITDLTSSHDPNLIENGSGHIQRHAFPNVTPTKLLCSPTLCTPQATVGPDWGISFHTGQIMSTSHDHQESHSHLSITTTEDLTEALVGDDIDSNGNYFPSLNNTWAGVPLHVALRLSRQLRLKDNLCQLPQSFLMKFVGKLDTAGCYLDSWRCYITGCTKECIRRDHALDHIRMHLNDRSWPCDMCDKSFLRAHDLKRHRDTHCNIRIWSCDPRCGRAFNRKDLLYRHIENSCPILKGTGKRDVPPTPTSYEQFPIEIWGIDDSSCAFCCQPAARPLPPRETQQLWVAEFRHATTVAKLLKAGNVVIGERT